MKTENELIKKLRIINKRNPALWNSVVAYINGANAALECGVRPVASERLVALPEPVASVALPETSSLSPVAPERSVALLEPETPSPSPVAPERSVALLEPETPSPSPVASERSVALPEAKPEPSVAPSSPTYRLVLNVPELGLKGFAD